MSNILNIHYYENEDHNVEESERNSQKTYFGCTQKVKELIETIVFEHGIIQPKKVSLFFYLFYTITFYNLINKLLN